MNFGALIDSVKTLPMKEKRAESESSLEVVLQKQHLDTYLSTLRGFLGEAAKPEGNPPTQEHVHLTAPYGGIRKNQILFSCPNGEKTALAMIWPWSDGETLTLKLLQAGRSKTEMPFWQKITGLFKR